MGGMVKGACALALAVGLCFTAVSGVCGARDQAASQGADDQGVSPDVNKPDQVNGANKGSATGKESQTKKNQVFTLGEVEVVGKEDETKNTTIERIYNDQMRLFDANNVATAANLEPGVTLSTSGQRNEQYINIRGFGPRDIGIFLDGVPIGDTYFGYPPLAEFTTYGISEMTISKGFTSVLYGPNTMGGAINLITMKPQKEYEVNGGSGYGSGNSYHGFANLGTNQGKWYFEGGGSYENQDYFNLSDSFTSTPYWGKGLTGSQGAGKRVNSDYYNWIAHAKVGLTPNDTDEYALSFMRLEEEKGSPPYVGSDPNSRTFFWRWPSWDFQDVHFNSNTAICSESYVKTTAFYDTYDNSLNSYTDGNYNVIKSPPKYSFADAYGDYSYGASVESGTKLVPYNFIKGAFHFKDDVHTEWGYIPYYPKFRDEDRNFSFGLEDTIDFTKRLYSIIGVSYDWMTTVEATYNSQTVPLLSHNTWNPQVGLFYKLTDTGTIHASIEEKSRFPTLQERYSSGGGLVGNPELKPEKATNYEIGYKDLLAGRLTVEATGFYDYVHDYIIGFPVTLSNGPWGPGGFYRQESNVGHVDLYGIELGLSGQILPCLKGGMNYTYLQYINVNNNALITDLPHNKVFAYLQYFTPVKEWSMLGSVEYNSARYSDSEYAPAIAGGYALVNFKEIYEISPGVTLEGGINNILDENWEIQYGYPLSGRTFFVQMRFKY
jgi:iron complex outermembrane recepter protein